MQKSHDMKKKKKKSENAQRIPAIMNIGSLIYVKSGGILYKYERP
jgi:hypothetical protein